MFFFFLRSESNCFAAEVEKNDGGGGDARWARGEAVVARFASLERMLFSMRLLRRTLLKLAPSAEQFSRFRQHLIKTHATLSAVHYILGKCRGFFTIRSLLMQIDISLLFRCNTFLASVNFVLSLMQYCSDFVQALVIAILETFYSTHIRVI